MNVSVARTVRTSIRRAVLRGGSNYGGLTLPRSGLLYCYRGGTVTIGLSGGDYDSVSAELQAIFFDAGPTLRDAEDILTDSFVSELLNLTYMIGNEDRGILLLYEDGTSRAILNRALRYCGQPIVEPTIADRYLNTDHYTNVEHYL